MFHLSFISIDIHKRSNRYLLLLAIFHNLEMKQFWSVNYICLMYKFLFWKSLTFWAIFMTDLWLLYSCNFFTSWRL